MKNNLDKFTISRNEMISLKTPDTLSVSNVFRDLFLSPSTNPEIINWGVFLLRFVFKITADVRNYTFSTKGGDARNKLQYSLFDEAMRTSSNTYTLFRYKTSELDANRNGKNIRKSLEVLEEYKKDWYTHTNSAGKKISSFGGLISQPTYSDGEVTFLISSYWMEQILNMDAYNETLYETVMTLKDTKQLLFYLWILRLPEHGTSVNFTTITETYDLNYKTARSLHTNFLTPLKNKLNKMSMTSFGAGVNGVKINLVKIALIQGGNLEEKTITKLKIRQKVKYVRERHLLDEESLNRFKLYISTQSNFDAANEAYKTFIKNCRIEKVKASDVKGNDFKTQFQNILLENKQNKIWEL